MLTPLGSTFRIWDSSCTVVPRLLSIQRQAAIYRGTSNERPSQPQGLLRPWYISSHAQVVRAVMERPSPVLYGQLANTPLAATLAQSQSPTQQSSIL